MHKQVIAPKKQKVAPMHRFSRLFKNKSMHRRNKLLHRRTNQLMHRSKFHRTISCTWDTSDWYNRLLHPTTYTINKRVAPNNSSNILSSRKGNSIGFFHLQILRIRNKDLVQDFLSSYQLNQWFFCCPSLSTFHLLRTGISNDFFWLSQLAENARRNKREQLRWWRKR